MKKTSLIIAIALMPSAALAEICDKARPDWDGTPVSALGEAMTLMFSPMGLFMLISTIAALRFRSQWGGVAVTVGWTAFASLVTMFDPTGIRDLAVAEGCIGQPALFVILATFIAAGTIIYTAPRKAQN